MNRQWTGPSSTQDPDNGSSDTVTISFSEIISIIRRRVTIILSTILLCVAVAGIYTFTVKPVYQGKAVVLIDPSGQSQVFGNQVSDALLLKDNLVVESEIEVIKSGQLLSRVATSQKIYSDPGRNTTSLLASTKKWIYEQLQISIMDSEENKKRLIFESFRKKVSANRIGLTYAIQVTYQAFDPKQTADITNAIARAYLDDKLETRYAAAKRTSNWLQQRLSSLQIEVLEAERVVELYKEKNDIVDVSAGLISDKQLSELNSQLILARAQTATAKARYDRIQIIVREKDADSALEDVLSSVEIIDLRKKYAISQNLARKLDERYGPSHLAVIRAKAEVGRVEVLILEEIKRIEQSYESTYEIAKASEKAFEKELQKLKGVYVFTGQKQVKLRELKRQAQASRDLYKSLLANFQRSNERESLPSVGARIIEIAQPPVRPSAPRKKLIFMLAIVFGVGAGIGLAFLRESLDKLVWTPETIEKLLGKNNLGLIPEVSIKIPKEKRRRRHVRKISTQVESEAEGTKLQLFNPKEIAPFHKILEDRFDHLNEVLRNILVTLKLASKNNDHKGAQVVAFISTVPSEGKSTISILQALYKAKSGHRTLLIDSDFRKPLLTKMLTPDSERGICELAIDGEPDLARYIWRDEQTGLDFLPASNNGVNARDIFLNEDISKMIDWFRGHYDYIIIDLPPILILPDARILADTIDHMIYVVEWGKIHKESIFEALKSSPELNDLIIGSVLNKVDIKKIKRYGGYYYGSGYYYS